MAERHILIDYVALFAVVNHVDRKVPRRRATGRDVLAPSELFRHILTARSRINHVQFRVGHFHVALAANKGERLFAVDRLLQERRRQVEEKSGNDRTTPRRLRLHQDHQLIANEKAKIIIQRIRQNATTRYVG